MHHLATQACLTPNFYKHEAHIPHSFTHCSHPRLCRYKSSGSDYTDCQRQPELVRRHVVLRRANQRLRHLALSANENNGNR